MTVTIYHNPKCSKSRQTLALLQEQTDKIQIIEYLKTPPTLEELKQISNYLNLKPSEFLRSKEQIIKESNIDLTSEDKILKAMSEEPILIERPIVIKNNKAVLGRPPENISTLF